MSDMVRYSQDGNVVTFTIDRPEARNAVNGQVVSEMEAHLDRFESDESAWVGILTGTGSVFCAGADLKEIAAGNANTLFSERGGFAGFVYRDRNKPIIAAINGHAHAGGCELVLACDMAVMADEATIALPEVKRSLVAAAGGVYRLPRLLGAARAAEMALTGDPISAETALDWGLVNQVVPTAEVLDTARALAGRVAANAPLAVQASRQVLLAAFDEEEPTLRKMSSRALADVLKTEDAQEGPRSFIEKRPPVWRGR